MSKTITIRCPKHGEVEFTGVSDLGRVGTLYCPKCEAETRQQHQHPKSPYPVQGTPSGTTDACDRGG